MSDDLNRNKEIVRRYLQHIDDRDAPGAAGLIADDAVWWIVGRGDLKKADIQAIHLALFGLTDEMHFTIVRETGERDRVVTEATVVYHTKDGRVLHNDICLFATVRAGKIQNAREFYDMNKPPLKLE